LYYYAVAAADLEKFDSALEGVDRVLEINPDWPQAHLLRAQILVKQDKTDDALADLQKAVAKWPRDPALRAGYAKLLISVERLADARREFETLAEQRPDDPEPLFALGLLAAQEQDYDTALAHYKEVLSRGGRAMEVQYELGKIEELRGNYGEARDWYARVSGGPRFLDAQVRRGVVLGRLQDFQAMAALFERLRSDYPNRAVQLYLAQADVLRREHRSFECFNLLSGALEENPGDEELLYSRALAAEKVERLDILEQDLTALIEVNPNNGQALNALGYTLADRTDRHQEALAYIERAIALLPNDAAVLDSMGWIRYRMGQYDESLDHLRRAYSLNSDAEIAAHLSEVLWITGQQDEARQVWGRAIEKNPGNPYLLAVKERFGL
jgi:tetratricopeptide (TPR) repeat protein